MNIKTTSKLSKIVDKMDLDIAELAGGLKKKDVSQQEFGFFIIGKIVPKLYLVEDEIVELIMNVKKITKEQAEEVDIVEFIKTDLVKGNLQDFFK